MSDILSAAQEVALRWNCELPKETVMHWQILGVEGLEREFFHWSTVDELATALKLDSKDLGHGCIVVTLAVVRCKLENMGKLQLRTRKQQ